MLVCACVCACSCVCACAHAHGCGLAIELRHARTRGVEEEKADGEVDEDVLEARRDARQQRVPVALLHALLTRRSIVDVEPRALLCNLRDEPRENVKDVVPAGEEERVGPCVRPLRRKRLVLEARPERRRVEPVDDGKRKA